MMKRILIVGVLVLFLCGCSSVLTKNRFASAASSFGNGLTSTPDTTWVATPYGACYIDVYDHGMIYTSC